LAKAREAGIHRALFISSGAVYGAQPEDVKHVSEYQFFGPDPLLPTAAYAEGKRAAEQLFSFEGLAGLSFSVARLWAFVGPLLPLDQHFAVGNFLSDALKGQRIRVRGDGTTVRSYQYASDMAAWCWSILASGENGQAYNVGSEESVTMRELAQACAELGGVAGVDIFGVSDPTKRVDRYAPSTQLIRKRLGLSNLVPLRDGLKRTMDWYSEQGCL
jgi:dTDP-glucose 4,6-dehydratase